MESRTPAQRILLLYCNQMGYKDVTLTGAANARVITDDYHLLHLTINIYGDIMDDDTKKIIADGNVSHDIRRIYEFPTEWKDRKPSVVYALREKNDDVKEAKAEKPKRQKTKNPER